MRPPLLRAVLRLSPPTSATRTFTTTRQHHAKNRLYPSRIRSDSELQTLILMSASSRVPLLTLWTTTWCPHSPTVLSTLQSLLSPPHQIGEPQGGVSLVEVEMDSPDLGGVSGTAARYGINNIPTLMAFDRSEAQIETKVSRLRDLQSEEFLRRWIETEAARHGEGGAGGKIGGLFAGIFGR